MSREYRVVWQREGMPAQRSRSHPSRDAAERHRTLLELRTLQWPPLIYARIESREISTWTPEDVT